MGLPPTQSIANLPHSITQRVLLHIFQALLSEFQRSPASGLGRFLPLALGLRVALHTSDLLDDRERRGH